MFIGWKGVIEGYSKKWAIKNSWKVKALGYEVEDLFQECYLIFRECLDNFSGIEEKMFMEYFKTALDHRIYRLSSNTKEFINHVVYLDDIAENNICKEEEATFYTRLSIDKGNVKEILDIIFSDDMKKHLSKTYNSISDEFIRNKLRNYGILTIDRYSPLKDLHDFLVET